MNCEWPGAANMLQTWAHSWRMRSRKKSTYQPMLWIRSALTSGRNIRGCSGSALLERQCLSHALNSKAVAKRYARERGDNYESLRLIVAHLGSGISISAHENGLMVDVTNSREEGAFSTERAGGVPVMQLVNLCFSGNYTQKQVEAQLFRDGGLYSYLGTKDLVEVERRIAIGETKAKLVVDAMVYQIAKEIGAMAAVLHGRVNACSSPAAWRIRKIWSRH